MLSDVIVAIASIDPVMGGLIDESHALARAARSAAAAMPR